MLDKKLYDKQLQNARKAQIDQVAGYLERYLKLNAEVAQHPVNNVTTEEDLQYLENLTIPTYGRDVDKVADELISYVYEKTPLIQHPKFYSYVSSAVSPYSLAGTILTDIYNPNGCGFSMAPGACIIEEKLIKWMAGRAGYDTDKCGGLFMSGGSLSNMTALIAARDSKLSDVPYTKGVAYISDQTHISVEKGLKMIGIRKEQIRTLPTDDDFKMRMDLLEETIKADFAKGLRPFVVIGTMGTTNTGSIDPLSEIADICQKYDLWMHVDGAYGGSILISDIYKNLAKGIERSDSFSWDTHKWAMQVYGCSSVVVKDKNDLLNSFSEYPEYLEDLKAEKYTDPWNLGPELSRPHRSLRLWFTLQAMGTDLLADVIDFSFYNSKVAVNELKKDPCWEIVSGPSCGTINFRYKVPGSTEEQTNALSSAISERILSENFAHIVTTTIKGKHTLRMCCINANTDTDDIIETVSKLTEIAHELA